MILTILSMIAAVACFSIKELAAHGKLEHWGLFWSENEWARKYKITWTKDDAADFMNRWHYQMHPAPDTWYYRFFKIKYKERWPTSATLTVAFTDGMHLAQAGFKLFLALSFMPLTGWIWAGVIWVLWGISFTIFYKILSR